MATQTLASRHFWASFNDYDHAAQVVAALLDHGVPAENVHLMTTALPQGYASYYRAGTVESGPVMGHAETGITVTTAADAERGAVKGAGIGLGVGILAGLAALVIPGVGLVIGGGALATAIAAAVGTGVAGGLAGAVTGYLKDQGAPDSTAYHIHEHLNAGDVVINFTLTNSPKPSPEEVNDLIQKYGGSEIMMPIEPF